MTVFQSVAQLFENKKGFDQNSGLFLGKYLVNSIMFTKYLTTRYVKNDIKNC